MPGSRVLITFLVMVLFAVGAPLLSAASGKKTSLPSAKTSLLTIKADLAGASALPSNGEEASGSVVGTYDPISHALRYQAHFVDLTGPATNARFYGSAAIDRCGWAIVAAARPEASLVSGTALLDKEEEQDLLAGRWYFNVTTQKHPLGEIRGAVSITPFSEQ